MGRDEPSTLDQWCVRGDTVWTVSQVNERIRDLLEGSADLQSLWVRGEVSNLKRSSTGHYYFNLIEKNQGASSLLSCVIWASVARSIRFDLREGDVTEVSGSIDVYTPGGRYSLQVARTKKTGEGDRFLLLERWRRELCEAGFFSPERKRQLPRYPVKIGVVTSETGAVIHDITNVIRGRFGAHIVLAPTPVQGETAHAEIARALERVAAEGVDLVIIARGGGSADDLFPFNNPEVVMAVARCPVPVISAVGHEVDITFCDLAADIRASTPSHAAELAVPDSNAELQSIRDQATRIRLGLRRKMEYLYEEVSRMRDPFSQRRLLGRITDGRELHTDLAGRMERAISNRIKGEQKAIGHLKMTLSASHPVLRFTQALADRREQLVQAGQRIKRAALNRVRSEKLQILSMRTILTAKNPLDLMKSGYSIVFSEGNIITSSKQLVQGAVITVRWADGSADATVRSVNPNENV